MIKAIIFDFAGVISKEGFLPVLVRNLDKKYEFDNSLFLERFRKHEEDYMRGKINPREFWKNVCRGFSIPFGEFEKVFASSYELNSEMIALIKGFKNKYKIILLTDNFETLANEIKSRTELNGLFDKTFFSNDTGLLKTEIKAFEDVLKEIGEKAEECIFTDDKEKNLELARQLGIKTIHFRDTSSFRVSLQSLVGVNIA